MCEEHVFSFLHVHASDPRLGGCSIARVGTLVFLTMLFLLPLCPPRWGPMSLSQAHHMPPVGARNTQDFLRYQFYFLSHLKHN